MLDVKLPALYTKYISVIRFQFRIDMNKINVISATYGGFIEPGRGGDTVETTVRIPDSWYGIQTEAILNRY